MFCDADVRRLVGAIYDAAYDAALWKVCFEDLATIMDATTVGFVCASRDGSHTAVSLFTNVEEAAIRDYAYFSDKNVFVQRTASLSPGEVFTDRQLVPKNELRHSEYYNDYLRRYDIAGGIGACIAKGDLESFISVNRPENRGDWSDDAEQLLRVLVPHVQCAVRLHCELSAAEHARRMYRQAADDLNVPTVVVNAKHRVMFANTAGRRILKAGDALLDRDGCLTAAHRDDRSQLSSLIQSAFATATMPWRDGPRWIHLRRSSTRPPLGVIAAPPPSTARDVGEPTAVLFLVDSRRASNRSAIRLLETLYGLTRSEATVAAHVANGIAPTQIARATHRSAETVRAHLKRVLHKTQTTSQSELVSLISTLPGSL